MTSTSHPNFPDGLDIKPLILGGDEKGSTFDAEIQEKAIQQYGIAGRIWEAAQLMIRYFDLTLSPDWSLDPPCSVFNTSQDGSDLTIVELGSGTGYVGLKLAEKLSQCGRRSDLLILTDLPDVCFLLQESLRNERRRWATRPAQVAVQDYLPVNVIPLPWGNPEKARELSNALVTNKGDGLRNIRYLSHLICSDLVYFPHLLAPLLRSLLQLTSPPFARLDRPPEVIISYKIRSLAKETAFWLAFGLWFNFSPVLVSPLIQPVARKVENGEPLGTRKKENWDILRQDGEMEFIFIALRRPESYDWTVPDNDDDLLSGIGAGGTITPKGDDTFEALLLMQVGNGDD
ncbi:hypothetical protein M0805_009877 [Coniferiporia weirii]|nr:hypothetical protein M0805_009877 [Coniferiporia weirii]